MDHDDFKREEDFIGRVKRQLRGTGEFSVAQKTSTFDHAFTDHELRVLIVPDTIRRTCWQSSYGT